LVALARGYLFKMIEAKVNKPATSYTLGACKIFKFAQSTVRCACYIDQPGFFVAVMLWSFTLGDVRCRDAAINQECRAIDK